MPGRSHAVFHIWREPFNFWRETRWKNGLDLVRFCTRYYLSPKMSLEDFCPVDPMPSFNFGAKPDGIMVWTRPFLHSLHFRQKCPLRIFARSIPKVWISSVLDSLNFRHKCPLRIFARSIPMVWISSVSAVATLSPKMSFEDFCPVDPMPSFNFWRQKYPFRI